jgi:elongation factor G
MAVEVVTPDQFMGDVIGDLNSRRGQVRGNERPRQGAGDRGTVPLANMFGYVTDLRSKTQGRAVSRCSSRTTTPCPTSVQEEIVAKAAAT